MTLLTPNYKIAGSRCVLSFNEPNEAFCKALAASKLFGGTTITNSFMNISFYAKSVCSLRDHLSRRREKLQYMECVRMAQHLGQQLFYLEKCRYTFSWFDLDNVLVIDDTFFLYVGMEQLKPIDATGRICFTAPFSSKQPHLAPEIKRLYILPSYVTYKAAYYSLGSLITSCLIDADMEANDQSCKNMLEPIAHTKLYWFLLRCFHVEPGARILLII